MSRFTEFTGITLSKEDRKKRITTKKMIFEVGSKGSGELVIVPKGFEFDGASIPRLFWSIYPPTEPSTILAVCLHDWLYCIKGRVLDYYVNNDMEIYFSKNYTRLESDIMMYDGLLAQGNDKTKSTIYFKGVSAFGWIYRNKELSERGKKYLNLNNQ